MKTKKEIEDLIKSVFDNAMDSPNGPFMDGGVRRNKAVVQRGFIGYIQEKVIERVHLYFEELMGTIENHGKRIEKLEKEALTCPICFKPFPNIKSYTNHIRSYRTKLERFQVLGVKK